MNVVTKLKEFFSSNTRDKQIQEERGYSPSLLSAIQAQGGIRFEPKYVQTGDGYITCLHVYKFQNVVRDYWLEPIFNMENVIPVLDVAVAEKKEVVELINKSMAEQNSRFQSSKENVERIDAQTQYLELDQLYKDISIGEVVKYAHLRLFVKGKTLEELEVNTLKTMEELESMNFRCTTFLNEQEWEWSSLVASYKAQLDYPNARRGKEIPASTLAGGYPFHYTSLSDPTGSYLGTTRTGGTILFDIFHKDKKRMYYNALMVGQMGSGKSTLLKKMVLEQAVKGNKIRILDVTGEFGDLVKRLGGTQIALDGSEGIINPLHVYRTAVNEDGTTNEESSFMHHLAKLKAFYTYLKPTSTDDEKAMYSAMLLKLYIQKGLWSENEQINKTIKITEFESTDYPTFSELLALIREELYEDTHLKIIRPNLSIGNSALLSSVELAIQNIVDIYGKIFDGHSSIKSFDDELIVSFPLRTLINMREVFQAQMFNIFNMLWDGMIVNGSHQFKKFNDGLLEAENAIKYLIIMDEAHNIINTKDIAKPAIEQIERYMREARKYFGGIFFVSHSINDFVPKLDSHENAENIKKLFQLTQYKFIAKQDTSAIPTIKTIFEEAITDSELQSIPRFEAGELVLAIAGVKNLTFKVEIPENEIQLFGGGA